MYAFSTIIHPRGILPVEPQLDEAQYENDEAYGGRRERGEEAEAEAVVHPVVGEGAVRRAVLHRE